MKNIFLLYTAITILVTIGLPHDQKNQEKLKKYKSQEKMGAFEKKSGIVRKFDKIKKKSSDFVRLIYKISLFSKAFK